MSDSKPAPVIPAAETGAILISELRSAIVFP
jgi:hypothetical protein